MKKWLILIIVAGLVGCAGPSKEKETPSPEDSDVEEVPKHNDASQENTEEKRLSEKLIEKIDVDFKVKLPDETTIMTDKNIAATVEFDENYYEVAYFETDESLEVNDAELINQEPVLRMTGRAYDSTEKATGRVGYEEIQEGMPEVDLGHDITGYQDAGAGSAFITWHEGRWSFTMRSRNDEIGSSQGREISTEIVEKLESQMLPIPHEKGSGLFNSGKNDEVEANRLAWQEENIIYEVYMKDALQLVDLVTNEFE